MAPIVTGEVNPAVLEDLIRLCVQLDKLRYPDPGNDPDPDPDPGDPGEPGEPGTDSGVHGQGAPVPDTTRAWEALEQAVIGKAVDLLSGPGGAGGEFLRRRPARRSGSRGRACRWTSVLASRSRPRSATR